MHESLLLLVGRQVLFSHNAHTPCLHVDGA